MNRSENPLKREIARLEADAATLHRHYADTPVFMIELAGLARSVLMRAGMGEGAWVRAAIDQIFDAYGVSSKLWLDGPAETQGEAAPLQPDLAGQTGDTR